MAPADPTDPIGQFLPPLPATGGAQVAFAGRLTDGNFAKEGVPGPASQGLAGDLALGRLARALGLESDQELLARYGEWQGLASLWLMQHPLAGRHASRPQRPRSRRA